MRIREIQFNDNSQIESVIKSIFIELRTPFNRDRLRRYRNHANV